MPAIINSAPDCITHVEGYKPPDDIADFILQDNYQDCAGFMTFGPGSTYGDGGTGAADVVHGPDLDRDRRHGDRLPGVDRLREPRASWPSPPRTRLAGRAPTDSPPNPA